MGGVKGEESKTEKEKQLLPFLPDSGHKHKSTERRLFVFQIKSGVNGSWQVEQTQEALIHFQVFMFCVVCELTRTKSFTETQ